MGSWKRTWVPRFAALALFAPLLFGAFTVTPRYIEELAIGGGTADSADGGADFEKDGDITTTGRIATSPSTTGRAGLHVPHGTAPSSPVNGDLWSTTAGFYGRVNGSTIGPWGPGGGNVSGPGSSTVNTFPVYANTSGTLLGTSAFSITNVGRLDQNSTITGNWVNTANPWADDEVSDQITVGASGRVNDAALTDNVTKLGQSIESSEITNGTIVAADTAITGTPNGNLFLRDDWSWATPAGGGDVTGPGSSTDGNLAAWNGASGTVLLDGGIALVNVGNVSVTKTITADWVNTAYPWADDEVSNEITVGPTGTVYDGALSGNVSLLGPAIDISEIDATGSPSSATFLRGDGTWTARVMPILFSSGNGNPWITSGCTAKALNAAGEVQLTFSNGQRAVWQLIMPSDFDGSVESIVITYRQRTSTGAITFKHGYHALDDGGGTPSMPSLDSMSPDTPGAADQLQIYTPSASGLLGTTDNANKMLYFWVQVDIAAGGNVELLGFKCEY